MDDHRIGMASTSRRRLVVAPAIEARPRESSMHLIGGPRPLLDS